MELLTMQKIVEAANQASLEHFSLEEARMLFTAAFESMDKLNEVFDEIVTERTQRIWRTY